MLLPLMEEILHHLKYMMKPSHIVGYSPTINQMSWLARFLPSNNSCQLLPNINCHKSSKPGVCFFKQTGAKNHHRVFTRPVAATRIFWSTWLAYLCSIADGCLGTLELASWLVAGEPHPFGCGRGRGVDILASYCIYVGIVS